MPALTWRVFVPVLLILGFLWLPLPASAQDAAAPVIVDLGTLGGDSSSSQAINARGQIVGSIGTFAGSSHAFLWHNGVMTDLSAAATDYSAAVAINERGQVLGYRLIGYDGQACLWDKGVLIELGTLGGGFSHAFALGNSGQVVGYGEIAPGGLHALAWYKGALTDLGALGGGRSFATAVNDRGQVIGQSTTAEGKWHAVLWETKVKASRDAESTDVSVDETEHLYLPLLHQ